MADKRKIKKDLKRLSRGEKKIYNSVMSHFPATSHESAMDAALQGGVRLQFIPK